MKVLSTQDPVLHLLPSPGQSLLSTVGDTTLFPSLVYAAGPGWMSKSLGAPSPGLNTVCGSPLFIQSVCNSSAGSGGSGYQGTSASGPPHLRMHFLTPSVRSFSKDGCLEST